MLKFLPFLCLLGIALFELPQASSEVLRPIDRHEATASLVTVLSGTLLGGRSGLDFIGVKVGAVNLDAY